MTKEKVISAIDENLAFGLRVQESMRKHSTPAFSLDGIELTEENIQRRIQEMAQEFASRYPNLNPHFLCLMDGGLAFAYAFTSALPKGYAFHLSTLQMTSYEGMESGKMHISGVPRDLRGPIAFLDDVYDTGRSFAAAIKLLAPFMRRRLASLVGLITLTNKVQERLDKPLMAGFDVSPREFLIGCSLDFKWYLRNLTHIRIANTTPVAADVGKQSFKEVEESLDEIKLLNKTLQRYIAPVASEEALLASLSMFAPKKLLPDDYLSPEMSEEAILGQLALITEVENKITSRAESAAQKAYTSDGEELTIDFLHTRIEAMADELIRLFPDGNPLLVGLMDGAFQFTGELRKILSSKGYEFQYTSMHVYRNAQDQLILGSEPKVPVGNRMVIVLTSIGITGKTFDTVKQKFLQQGAKHVEWLTGIHKAPSAEQKRLHTPLLSACCVPNHTYLVGWGLHLMGLLNDFHHLRAVTPSAVITEEEKALLKSKDSLLVALNRLFAGAAVENEVSEKVTPLVSDESSMSPTLAPGAGG